MDVQLVWFEYGPCLDAFAAGKVDAAAIVCGDALVTGGNGKPSTAIVLEDYSNGNDMIIGKPGIKLAQGPQGQEGRPGAEPRRAPAAAQGRWRSTA